MILEKKYNSPLLFMHITKTAGGSLLGWFREQAQDNLIYYDHTAKKLYQQNSKLALSSDFVNHSNLVIFGHFVYGFHRKHDFPPKYACIVRHPIYRTISHYYHLYNIDAGNVGQKIRDGGANINMFFEESYHWEFNNFLCKLIAGIGFPSDKSRYSNEEIYDTAVQNVDRYFEFIGIYEYLHEVFRFLANKYRINLSTIPQVNKGDYLLSHISENTILKIKHLNYYDLLLYRKLASRFIQLMTKIGV